MDEFLKNLPKIELHAHLNGSLSISSIEELNLALNGERNIDEFKKLGTQFLDFDGEDNDSLDKCFKKFEFMHQLTATRQGLKLALEMVIRDFAKENVVYLELRTTPKENQNMSRRDYLNVIIDILKNYQNFDNIVVKLIISIDRSQSVEIAKEILNLAIDFKENYNEIVKGLDLSGNPNKGNFKDFEPLLLEAKQHQLMLALHCAEVDNAAETQEMLDFGFNRCGHGTYLSETQLQQCQQQNIAIECCLTSNVKCKTVSSYDLHHFKTIFKKQIRTVLCTDDSGVFNCTLTDEFRKAWSFYNLNQDDIERLCLNAVDSSFANDMEKSKLRKIIKGYIYSTKFIDATNNS